MNPPLSKLAALLHLASPALPIGGFSYSQGLEAAIECGLVNDASSAERWIADNLEYVMACAEAPLWVLQYRHWEGHDVADAAALAHWNAWFLATRESRELRLETEQMGWSLAQLITQLEWGGAGLRQQLLRLRPLSLPTAFAAAAVALQLDCESGLTAYCFSWAENQVAAAIKAIPLGQLAGQKLLFAMHARLPTVVAEAVRRANADPPQLSTFSPHLGVLSARHETQYSRLFRS